MSSFALVEAGPPFGALVRVDVINDTATLHGELPGDESGLLTPSRTMAISERVDLGTCAAVLGSDPLSNRPLILLLPNVKQDSSGVVGCLIVGADRGSSGGSLERVIALDGNYSS